MLKGILDIESKDFSKYCCSIDSKLPAYEYLMDVAALLELALWKAAISDHEETDPNHKLQYRTFLMSNVVEDAGMLHADSK